jgi:hypothetical protein
MFERYSTDYYVLDVSAFISVNHLQDIRAILNVAADREKTTLILPTILYHELKKVIITGEISPTLKKILYSWAWRGYYVDYPMKRDYRILLEWFFGNFKIQPAENIVGEVDKIGEQTLKRDDIINKLGDILGSIVFEILAVSYKLKCHILAFGGGLISLARRLKITTIMFSSKLKDELRSKANVRRALRILRYIATIRTTQQILGDIIPDPSVIVVGILLIADG